MTYTILGRCRKTGRLGIGIATFSITVGRYCYGVRAGTGVTISQAFANEGNNQLALRLLAQGFEAGTETSDGTNTGCFVGYVKSSAVQCCPYRRRFRLLCGLSRAALREQMKYYHEMGQRGAPRLQILERLVFWLADPYRY